MIIDKNHKRVKSKMNKKLLWKCKVQSRIINVKVLQVLTDESQLRKI